MVRSEGKAYLIGVVEEPFFPGDETHTMAFPGKHSKVGTHRDRACKGIFVARSRSHIVQYPPGTMFPWNMDPEMRASMAAEGKEAQAAPALPGAVPELVASNKSEGWVREPRDTKAELADKLVKGSQITAAQWAAQGVRQQTKLNRVHIQELIGLQPADDLPDTANAGGGQLSAEDDPEFMTDPTQKALLEQQLAEEDEAARASNAAAEAKVMLAARKAVAIAEQIEDRRRRALEHSERDKEEDTLLWGYPQPSPPTSFGSEPRTALLVRGEHVVVVAIEGPALFDEDGAGTGDPTKRLGRRLGIKHFVRSLRAGGQKSQRQPRAVVVVAERTPRDWGKVAAEGHVYLVLGNPLSASTLKRAGLEQAHAVVVHQRNASADRDPSTADAEAVFACRLVERMAATAGRDLPVICDFHLDVNTPFVPFGLQWYELGDAAKEEDEDKKVPYKVQPFFAQSRFVSGHLFVSSVAVSLAANMLYKPTLGHFIQELLRKQFAVVPIPEDFKGRTFGQLYEHLVRKNNLMAMALLRRKDTSEEDLEEEDEENDDGEVPVVMPISQQPVPPGRWSTSEPPSDRYVYVQPRGSSRVADHDGVLCAVATTGRVVLPPPGKVRKS